MNHWTPKPPTPSNLGDRAVPLESDHLAGKRIALLVTGGIAAMKAPLVARALRRLGASVTAFASEEALRYVTEETLAWSTSAPVVTRLTPSSEHLSDEDRFHAYLVAPATYNTINKIACGIADGVITATIASALGRMERGECAVLVCPTMHGSMHTKILTASLERLQSFGVTVVPPRDDYGKHNLPDEGPIAAAVAAAVSASPVRGRRILVTGGPVPARLDAVRLLSSPFTGALAIEIAKDLHLCGADVSLILGSQSIAAPSWLNATLVSDISEYREGVLHTLAAMPHCAAVLSAAVADFAPRETRAGKTNSASGPWSPELVATPKVIDEVHTRFPSLEIVGFKYEVGESHENLMRTALARAARHGACLANRADENPPGAAHLAWLTARGHDPIRLEGKPDIARAIREHLEHCALSHRPAHP